MQCQILDVAETLCAVHGPSRLRHTMIALELGIKPPSLYAHFPSLTAILAATTRRALCAICETYEEISGDLPPLDALNLSQSRQIDLMLARPGIARLVLFDLSQPGGAETVGWDTPEIIHITDMEQRFFKEAVLRGDLQASDFRLWFSTRLGALYVALSYEWLSASHISESRVHELKKQLRL